MGQRSQIYVITKKDDKYYIVANYYQWNYGERMISRVRGTLEQIVNSYIDYDWYLTRETKKLQRIMDVNWDMHDIVISQNIIQEFFDDYEECWKTKGKIFAEDFYDFCFTGQDNNDGQAYIFIDLDDENKPIKYGFIEYTFEGDNKILNPTQYLNWNTNKKSWISYMKESEYYNDETIRYTKRNIKYIKEHASLLETEELNTILKKVSLQFENKYKHTLF